MSSIHSPSNGKKSATGQQVKQEAIDIIGALGLPTQTDDENPRRNIIITQTKKGKTVAVLPHESIAVDRACIMREYGETLKKQHRGIKVILATKNNSNDENKKIAIASKGKLDKVLNLSHLSDFLEKN